VSETLSPSSATSPVGQSVDAEAPLSISEVGDLVRLIGQASRAGRFLLGLTGAPGAGKTTVAEAVVAALGESAVHVPMDGFHLSDEVLVRLGRRDRKGASDTFDARGYTQLLDRIRHDMEHTIYAPAFSREIEQPVAGSIAIEPHHRTVVSEGNYLLLGDGLWAGVADHFDAIWFLQTDQQLRLDRVVRRHIEFGKDPDVARSWVDAVDEQNARLVHETRTRADLIVDVTRLTITPPGSGPSSH